jgi:hypothetical protein
MSVRLGEWLAWLGRGARACFSGAPTPPPRLVLEERLALAPKQCLYLVRCGSEHFLLATGGEGGLQWVALADQPAHQSVLQPAAQSVSQSAPQSAPRGEARAKPRSMAGPQARAEARAEVRPEARPDYGPEARPQAGKARRRPANVPGPLAAAALALPGGAHGSRP